MPFNERSRLDTSQVEDRRGRGLGTAVAAGGGGLGVVILLVAILLGVNPADLTGVVAQAPSASTENTTQSTSLAEALPDGGGREYPRGLPRRGLRQQHPGFLDRRILRAGAPSTP